MSSHYCRVWREINMAYWLAENALRPAWHNVGEMTQCDRYFRKPIPIYKRPDDHERDIVAMHGWRPGITAVIK